MFFANLGLRSFMARTNGIGLSLASGQRKSVLAVLGRDGKPKPGSIGSVEIREDVDRENTGRQNRGSWVRGPQAPASPFSDFVKEDGGPS